MPPVLAQEGCAAIPEPAGWWTGDQTANDLLGVNHGALRNGATYAAGLVGDAFSFDDRSTAHVTVPDAQALNVGTGDFSMEAWIKTSSTKDIGSIQHKMQRRSGYTGYHFFLSNGGIGPGVQFADGPDVVTISASRFIADGQFHHVAVAVRRNDNDGIKLFLDGNLVATGDPTAASGSLDNTTPMLIGGHTFDSWRSFDGQIDEFTLFKRALTDEDIRSIYRAGSAGKCKGESFAQFNARAELTLRKRANDDAYQMSGFLRLSAGSDGIDPLTEPVTLKIGSFSATLPAGSFGQDGDTYRYAGPADRSWLIVIISPLAAPDLYSFRSTLVKGNLAGTTLPPKVQLSIGDDQGEVTLDLARVRVGHGQFGEKWLSEEP